MFCLAIFTLQKDAGTGGLGDWRTERLLLPINIGVLLGACSQSGLVLVVLVVEFHSLKYSI